jgi:ElaB/YqjD/DUF883 family membrane-anchored ribosome-binding protein
MVKKAAVTAKKSQTKSIGVLTEKDQRELVREAKAFINTVTRRYKITQADAKKRIAALVSTVKKTTKTKIKQGENYIKKHPVKSMGAVLTAGALLGMAVRGKSKTKK